MKVFVFLYPLFFGGLVPLGVPFGSSPRYFRCLGLLMGVRPDGLPGAHRPHNQPTNQRPTNTPLHGFTATDKHTTPPATHLLDIHTWAS